MTRSGLVKFVLCGVLVAGMVAYATLRVMTVHVGNPPLDLPQGGPSEQAAPPPVKILVTVNERTEVFVNGKPTKVEELTASIEQLCNDRRRTSIVVRADRKTIRAGDIMPVLDAVSRTGIPMTLALQPGPPK